MQGKVVIITGASDGIGAIAARELHDQGATVIVVGRSPEKTKKVAKDIGATYYTADFAKLRDVRKLAADIQKAHPRIDVLINNAGGIFGKRELTEDGHEKTIQVNHLAPFLLTQLLIDTLIKSKATIINTSSVANRFLSKFDINDLDLEENFSANTAYGNAKLANILFTSELQKRYGKQGISAVAVHPGTLRTNFASDTTSIARFIYNTPLSKVFLDSPEKGADPLVWLATSKPVVDWDPGTYYEKRKVGRANKEASKPGIADKLWDLSEEYTAA